MEKAIALRFENVSYAYTENGPKVISSFDLSVEEGCFTTILGPSGCGKTTILRLISGFLEPKEGKVLIQEKDQSGIEPENRGIGMVFQDYALFPHLTVKENILYGLRIHRKDLGFDKKTMEEKVMETSRNLDLLELLDRYPHELSGGQQQRVALARALVLSPKLLLMDEPLSSLDTQLRVKVREELKAIQKKCGITTIYVTHDQEEALFLSDSIAVLKDGRVIQTGSPEELYFHPADKFVAEFIGNANFLMKEGKASVVRPEWLKVGKDGGLKGTIVSKAFLGEKTRVLVKTEVQTLVADLSTLDTLSLKVGEEICLEILHQWKIS